MGKEEKKIMSPLAPMSADFTILANVYNRFTFEVKRTLSVFF